MRSHSQRIIFFLSMMDPLFFARGTPYLRGLVLEQQVVIAKVPPVDVEWKFFVFAYSANTPASSCRKALEFSLTAFR
jgi:hypothetical protein